MESLRFDLFVDPIEKSVTRKFYLILGVFLGIVSLAGLIVGTVKGKLFQMNSLILLSTLITSSGYVLQSLEIVRFKKSLYLEFADTYLKFRLKPRDNESVVKYAEIESVEFMTNEILFKMKDSNSHRLVISEFGYSKIQQIKEKLNDIKKHVA